MKLRRSQRGSALVEAAIALPVFFLMLTGIIEFGRAFNVYQVMTDAAREGARLAVAPIAGSQVRPDDTQVREEVYRFLDSAAISRSSTTVEVTQSTAIMNDVDTTFTEVTVENQYEFLFMPLPSVRLTTQAVMRNETN
jgi:Flp pilus assembly protein TadG